MRVLGLICLILAVLGGTAYAQGRVFIDSTGTVYPVGPKAISPFKTPAAPNDVLKSGNVIWNISYDDVTSHTGYGFDDPVQGATRRATVRAVLDYINSVLNVNTGATLDVNFRTSQMDGDYNDFLAAAGTSWTIGVNEFQGGSAYEHLTTGTDTDPPNVDIFCTVDFGFSWNSNHTVTPTGSQMDLFSVLLHEMTHGIGYSSLATASGGSMSNGGYTFLDRWMQYGGTYCFNSSTCALQVSSAAFTSDNLFFNGPTAVTAYGSRPPIYAPVSYEPGSSLSHLKASTNSVMQPSIGAGVVRRTYAPVDVGVLRDIGYGNAAVSAPVANFTATPTSGDAPLTVAFTDTSTNAPSSWAWDFNNDSTVDSTSQNPTYTYNTPGTYTVRLTATNNIGSDPEVKTGFITVNTVPQNMHISLDYSYIVEGRSFTLTATPSSATSYRWYRNGQLISGASGSTYTVPSASAGSQGSYTCVITTPAYGEVTTPPVVVVVHLLADMPTTGMIGLSALALALVALAAAKAYRARSSQAR
jgi:PKD repeat protein